MDCDHFTRLVDAWLDGSCSDADWREASAHMAECGSCRRQFEGLSGRTMPPAPVNMESLTSAIVERTSGAARVCASARERLGDLADGTLDAFDRDLVEAHLASCQPCAQIASVMVRALAVLPSMAEVDPPAGLERAVLAATSRRARPPSLTDRILAWTGRVAARPRLAFEVAYVFTLLLVIVLGDPVKAFRSASEQGAAYVQPRVQAVAQRLTPPLADARRLGTRTLEAVAAATKRPATASAAGGQESVVARWWTDQIDTRVNAVLNRLSVWARSAWDLVNRMVGRTPRDRGPAPASPGPSPTATEPGARAARSSR